MSATDKVFLSGFNAHRGSEVSAWSEQCGFSGSARCFRPPPRQTVEGLGDLEVGSSLAFEEDEGMVVELAVREEARFARMDVISCGAHTLGGPLSSPIRRRYRM